MSRMLNDVIHEGFKCSKCGTNPIRGIRFRCMVCQDLNLCEICEINDDHSNNHAMIKIRRPECDTQVKEEIVKKVYE